MGARHRRSSSSASQTLTLLAKRHPCLTSVWCGSHFQRRATVAKVGCDVQATPREMELFKQLLKQVARLDKRAKEWVLK